jgi:pimeloyl-ACP methyl ester carboxylesterase
MPLAGTAARVSRWQYNKKVGEHRRSWLTATGAVLIGTAVMLTGVRPERADSQQMPALPTTEALAAPGSPVLNSSAVYVPAHVDGAPVLLALHGQAGTGPGIAQRLRECAERNGWLLIAPTLAYRDFLDPDQVRQDGEENLPAVHALLDQVRAAMGLQANPRVFVYGFSRGAQMAHLFAMTYPHEVLAVAALSAGSYTLPEDEDASHAPLDYPFGVADLESVTGESFDSDAFMKIPFWIGVGAADTNPLDIGRAWDPYEGQTRVERAQAFAAQLAANGAAVSVNMFSGVGHEETASMRAAACAFLAAHRRGA